MENIVKRPTFKPHYDNYIDGKFVAPVKGVYFDNISPIDGKVFTKAARSSKEDVELALDAAHEAFKTWSKSSPTYRSNILLKIAQKIEDNLEYLATVETIDNGKAIRETLAADLPLVVDHFRYFAGVIRADEGSIAEHDEHTVSIALHEPIGVVAQIDSMEFPFVNGHLENSASTSCRLLYSCKTSRTNPCFHYSFNGTDRRPLASGRTQCGKWLWHRGR